MRQSPPCPGAADALDIHGDSRLRLTVAETLRELRDDLMRASYQPGGIRLDSGVEQPYFFDKYLMFARPAILRRLSRVMAGVVPEGIERLAAPTLGAVSLGTAISLESGLPLAVVRTDWDESRRGRPVEGGLHSGETVALIEDVVVTGTRALQAVRRLESAGAEVSAVLSVIDCERGAGERLESAAVRYIPLFQYSALSQATENQ